MLHLMTMSVVLNAVVLLTKWRLSQKRSVLKYWAPKTRASIVLKVAVTVNRQTRPELLSLGIFR